MGDRSNVFIQTEKRQGLVDDHGLPRIEWDGIGFYSHWGGTTSQARALIAAEESTERLGDPAYFARRVIHKILLTCADPDSATGSGLWVDQPCDNEYPILVLNAYSGLAWLCGDNGFRQDAPATALPFNEFKVELLQ